MSRWKLLRIDRKVSNDSFIYFFGCLLRLLIIFFSFVINPIERVKVLMQADTDVVKRYTSSIDCGVKVVQEDGIFGLIGRGLDATLVIGSITLLTVHALCHLKCSTLHLCI